MPSNPLTAARQRASLRPRHDAGGYATIPGMPNPGAKVPKPYDPKKDPETATTGEVVTSITRPDGSQIPVKTPSGAPFAYRSPTSKSTLIDPVDGTPLAPDPMSPTGLTSKFATARAVARKGRLEATVPGFGTRDVGEDPAQAERDAAQAKKDENNREADQLRILGRPFVRLSDGRPVKKHTDEEWAAKNEEAARAKASKIRSNLLNRKIDAIETEMANPDYQVLTDAAKTKMSKDVRDLGKGLQFAINQKRGTVGAAITDADLAELEADPLNGPLARQYRESQTALSSADTNAKRKLALQRQKYDLLRQLNDPVEWEQAKREQIATAAPSELDDFISDSTEFVQEQDEDITNRDQALAEKDQSFVNALDKLQTQHAQMLARGASGDELEPVINQHNEILVQAGAWDRQSAGARTALKAQVEQRNARVKLMAEAEAKKQAQAKAERQAAFSTFAAMPGMKPYASRIESLGLEEGERMARLTEKYGDEIPTEALQALNDDLNNQRRNVIEEANTVRHAAQAKIIEAGSEMYADWGKDWYTTDWQSENGMGWKIKEEAARLGIDEQEVRYGLQMARALDWQTPNIDPRSGEKLDEPSRALPNGNITVNPTLWGDKDAYEAALAKAPATPEAREAARQMFPALQREHAKAAVKVLAAAPALPGVLNFRKWREAEIAKGGDFAAKPIEDQAIQYMEAMRVRPWARKFADQIGTNLAAGLVDVTTMGAGIMSIITGATTDHLIKHLPGMEDAQTASEAFAGVAADSAGESAKLAAPMDLERANSDTFLKIIGQASRMAPPVAMMLATGGLAASEGVAMTAASVAAGSQTAGQMFAEIYRERRAQGQGHQEAWNAAAPAAAAGGLVTGLLTKGGGATGIEALLRNKAGQDAFKATFKTYLKNFVVGGLKEMPEETADELISQVIEGIVKNPENPGNVVGEFITNLPTLLGAVGLMGGASEAAQHRRDSGGSANLPEDSAVRDKALADWTPEEADIPDAVAAAMPASGFDANTARRAASVLLDLAQGRDPAEMGTDLQTIAEGGVLPKAGKVGTALAYMAGKKHDKVVISRAGIEWLARQIPGIESRIDLSEQERLAQIKAEENQAGQKTADKGKPNAQGGATASSPDSLSGNVGSTPASASNPTPTPNESPTPRPISGKLPQALAGAKPRYSHGSKQFELAFASDFDRAAYIAAQDTPSKADAQYVAWAVQASGLSEQQVRAHGQRVKASIKRLANNKSGGVLTIVAHTPEVQNPADATAGNEAPAALAGVPSGQSGLAEGSGGQPGSVDAGGGDTVDAHADLVEATSRWKPLHEAAKNLPTATKELLSRLTGMGVKVIVAKNDAEVEALIGKKTRRGFTGLATTLADGSVAVIIQAGRKSAVLGKSSLESTLDHELIHAASILARQENPEAHAAALQAVTPNSSEFDKQLHDFMRKEYSGYDGLTPTQKLEEALRAIIEGRYKQQTSSGVFRQYLQAFLGFISSTLPAKSPALMQAVANIEAVMGITRTVDAGANLAATSPTNDKAEPTPGAAKVGGSAKTAPTGNAARDAQRALQPLLESIKGQKNPQNTRILLAARALVESLEQFGNSARVIVSQATPETGDTWAGMHEGRAAMLIDPVAAVMNAADSTSTNAAAVALIRKRTKHELIHVAALERLNAGEVAELWELLPASLKEKARAAYFAAQDAAGTRMEFRDAFQGGHEWLAQLIETEEFGEIANALGALEPSTLKRIVDLLTEYMNALLGLESVITDPQALALIRERAELVKARLREMGVLEAKAEKLQIDESVNQEPKPAEPGPGPEKASNKKQAKPPAAKSELTPEQRQERAQTIRDMMATNRENKKPIPQAWVNRLAELEGAPKAQEGEIYSNVIDGHPQHEVSHNELQYLIPIKISKASDLDSKFERAQALLDRWNKQIGALEYQAKNGKSPALRKKAASDLAKLGSEKDARDILRDTIIPELERLYKEAESRTPPAEASPAPASQPAPAAKPPEQMTPEEFDEYVKQSGREYYLKHGKNAPMRTGQLNVLQDAIEKKLPVSVAAFDAQVEKGRPIALPEGYIREGDLYVYRPAPEPASQPDAADQALADAFSGLFAPQVSTPEQDAAYLAAVESGDLAKAQAMVDEADQGRYAKAKAARSAIVKDGSALTDSPDDAAELSVLKRSLLDTFTVPTGFILDGIGDTRYGSIYAFVKDPGFNEKNEPTDPTDYKLSIRNHEPSPFREKEFGKVDHYEEVQDIQSLAEISAAMDRLESWLDKKGYNQDAVTRDESGQVIPLSQRFNPESDSILRAPGVPAIEQADLPKDRRAAMLNAAGVLIDAGVNTPEELARRLDKLAPGGQLRRFSRSFWRLMSGFDSTLAENPDWNAIYSELADPPKSEPADQEQEQEQNGATRLAMTVSANLLAALERQTPLDLAPLRKASSLPAKELDEAIELGITMAAHHIAQTVADPKAAYAKLVELYRIQPKLNAKTSTSKIDQAYSTPAPLAYLASRLADVKGGKVVMDSAAGHAMLMLEADNGTQTVIVNEINPARRERMRALGLEATGEDATEFEPSQKPDRINMNPPFGTVMDEAGENKEFVTPAGVTTSIDYAIMLQALQEMQDDGRATFIIGGPNPLVRTLPGLREWYNQSGRREFFSLLHDNYNVIDHFTVAGELYEKQGAGWPVDVITIAGRGKSKNSLPAIKPPRKLTSWEELSHEIDRTDNDRRALGQLSESDLRQEVDGLAGKLGGLSGGLPGTRGDGKPGRSGGKSSAGTKDGQTDSAGTPESGGNNPDVAGASEPVGSAARKPEGRVEAADVGQSTPGSDANSRPVEPVVEQASDYQVEYVSASGKNPGGMLIPVNMAEPVNRALARLKEKVGDLNEYVRDKLGYPKGADLSFFYAEQIDAIAQAIYNAEHGGALVIGDQTGTGKGRIVAGLLKYAVKKGLIPVFVTKDQQLLDAMLDDLKDIQATEVLPVITNNKIDEKALNDKVTEMGILNGKESLSSIAETGKLPAGANSIWTTYSQIQSDDAPGLTKGQRATAKNRREAPPGAWRMDMLGAVADRAFFILDEAHLASGESTTGWRFASLLNRAPHVYYSSATFAKRPENMGIYFRTNLSRVAGGLTDLMNLMNKGGVPAMQVASSMLAEDGQYMRRERSFAGVEMRTHIARDTYEQDKALADAYTSGLHDIIMVQQRMGQVAEAVNDLLAAAGKRLSVPAANRPQISSTNFSAKLHNLVRQYLLGIKARPAAQEAIRQIRAGSKVIMTVENTMEAIILDLRRNGLPMTFKGALLMYLDSMRTLTVSGGGYGRAKQTWTLRLEAPQEFEGVEDRELLQAAVVRTVHPETGEPATALNDAVVQEMMRRAMVGVYKQAHANISELELGDMPISPIDAMRQAVEAAGIRTGEMTGREWGVDSQGQPYQRTRAEIKSKLATKDAFNNEDLDFMVINKTGSTGVSMHASERFKNKKQRCMIIVQANLDINEFMQALGRIHRSGQVVLPFYIDFQTALPAEFRPAAIRGQKMAKLNANTSSNDESEVTQKDAIDIFNKYGDEVVHSYLAKNPNLVADIDLSWEGRLTDANNNLLPLNDWLTHEQGEGYLSRSVTGHLAILPVDDQEAFWDQILSDYKALISYLDETGQNDLRASVLDLKAKTTARTLLTSGVGGEGESVFMEPSYVETVDTEMGREPMEADDVMAEAAKAEESRAKILSDYLAGADAWIADKLASMAQKRVNWNEAKAKEARADMEAERDRIASVIGQLGTFGTYARDDGTNGFAMLKSVKLNPEKPVTPSEQKGTLLINDSRYQLPVPFTKMAEFLDPVTYGEKSGWTRTLDFGTTHSIATGNLLAALAHLEGVKARIITYTTESGEVKMGVLLPSSYTKDQASAAQHRLPVDSFENLQSALNNRRMVESAEGVKFAPTKDGVLLRVPASRSAGGKFWRNPQLNRLMQGGEFRQVGNEMVATIPDSNLDLVFDLLRRGGESFTQGHDALFAPAIPALPLTREARRAERLRLLLASVEKAGDTARADALRGEIARLEPEPLRAPQVLAPKSSNPSNNIHELYQSIKRSPADDTEWRKSHPQSLLRWAEANNSLISTEQFREIYGNKPLALGGQEHAVWKTEDGYAIKITASGVEWGAQQSLDRYLYSLARSNSEFGDSIDIVGVVVLKDGWPRLVISQPWIEGKSATQEQIDGYMKSKGYAKLAGPRPGEYKARNGDIIRDALPKNVIITDAGEVKPIDIMFSRPRTEALPDLASDILRTPDMPEGQDFGSAAKTEDDIDFDGLLAEMTADWQDGESAAKVLSDLDAALPISRAEADALRARAEAEPQNERQTGNPQFANPGQTEDERRTADAIQYAYRQRGLEEATHDQLRAEVAEAIKLDRQGVEDALFAKIHDNELFNDRDVFAAKSIRNLLQREARMSGNPEIQRRADILVYHYFENGTEAARALSARQDEQKGPAERLREYVTGISAMPGVEMRARLKAAYAPAEKLRRLKELERRAKDAGARTKAALQADIAALRAEKDREELFNEFHENNRKKVKDVLERLDVTEDDLIFEGEDRHALQEAILSLPAIVEAMQQYNKPARAAIKLAMQGFGDAHIAKVTGIDAQEVAKLADDFRNVVLKRELAAAVRAGSSFGSLMQSGLDALRNILRAPVTGRFGNLVTGGHIGTGDARRIGAEVDRILNFSMPPNRVRNRNINPLRTTVTTLSNGQKVRLRIPFDPADYRQMFRIGREMAARESSAYDKVYEYWVNGILSGPQTQIANLTGNLGNVGWHYLMQRPVETLINLVARDKDSAQLGEWPHVLRGLMSSVLPAWKQAVLAFDTEADMTAHEYLKEPVSFDLMDTQADKVGGARASIGPGWGSKTIRKAGWEGYNFGRAVRVPGRTLRLADAMFKTVILHAEAAAWAYRRGKAAGFTGKALQTFITNELAQKGSTSWTRAMSTAEELLFQDRSWLAELAENNLGRGAKIGELMKEIEEAARKGDHDKANRLRTTLAINKFAAGVLRFIFPFKRTPANILRVGVRKAGGSAAAILFNVGRGLYGLKDGKPFFKSYPVAQMVKDLAESVLAGFAWMMLASMVEGDEDDDKKRLLIVGSRPFGLSSSGERQSMNDRFGGSNVIIWRDAQGNETFRFAFGRYEPFATALGVMVDSMREGKRWVRARANGADRTKTDLLYAGAAHLMAQASDKTFLQGLGDMLRLVEDLAENRARPGEAASRWLIQAVVPNLVRQTLRNGDDMVRNYKTADWKHSAWPDGSFAEPATDTFGNQVQKGGNALQRVFFQVPNKQQDQPDRVLQRWNLQNPQPKAPYFPAPSARDDYYIQVPGSKTKLLLTSANDKAAFDQAVGREYAKQANVLSSTALPHLQAKPDEALKKSFMQARSNARKLVRESLALTTPLEATKPKR